MAFISIVNFNDYLNIKNTWFIKNHLSTYVFIFLAFSLLFIDIQHILEDGSLEATEQAESRLLELVGLPPEDLFRNRSEMIEQAYDLQAERIAYSEAEAPAVTSGGMP